MKEVRFSINATDVEGKLSFTIEAKNSCGLRGYIHGDKQSVFIRMLHMFWIAQGPQNIEIIFDPDHQDLKDMMAEFISETNMFLNKNFNNLHYRAFESSAVLSLISLR